MISCISCIQAALLGFLAKRLVTKHGSNKITVLILSDNIPLELLLTKIRRSVFLVRGTPGEREAFFSCTDAWHTLAFAVGLTAYFITQFLVLSYVRKFAHLRPLWFANVANNILWFTFVKACWRAMGAACGKSLTFKTTIKGANALMNSAVGDLWMPVLVLGGCLASFGEFSNLKNDVKHLPILLRFQMRLKHTIVGQFMLHSRAIHKQAMQDIIWWNICMRLYAKYRLERWNKD